MSEKATSEGTPVNATVDPKPLKLYPVCGNPWVDGDGNLHVECPKCFHKYMRRIKWPLYLCGNCGQQWEIVR